MSPEELRALADEATPGPWRREKSAAFLGYITGGLEEAIHDVCSVDPDEQGLLDARLIALAPALARLCAEMGEALESVVDDFDIVMGPACDALAKLAELEAR